MDEHTMQDITSFTIPDPSPDTMRNILTFTVPDLSPDTKLEIYDRTFEVHSMVLRLHSGFFRKFLVKKGSSDESNSDSGFGHHLVVKDDGDVWGFQPVEHVRNPSLSLPIGNCLRLE